jgi:hypothetical protein
MTATATTSANAGANKLAAFLAADPNRLPVLNYIRSKLEADGRVGDLARFYIVRNGFRRAVFRGTLIATGLPVPEWAKETPDAAFDNLHFIEFHREAYNRVRNEQRHERRGHSPVTA